MISQRNIPDENVQKPCSFLPSRADRESDSNRYGYEKQRRKTT